MSEWEIESIRRLRSKEFLLKVESGRIRLQAVARFNFSAFQLGAYPTAASFAVIDLGVRIARIQNPQKKFSSKINFRYR